MLPDNTVIGDDGDYEWVCPHGVGHSPNPHTCEGCCMRHPEYDEWLKKHKTNDD
jgi:hypothetical protein